MVLDVSLVATIVLNCCSAGENPLSGGSSKCGDAIASAGGVQTVTSTGLRDISPVLL